MRRSFTKEERKLYNDGLKYAEPREALITVWWTIFSIKKFFILIDGLKAGKSWMYAFREAKNLNKK